MRVGGCYLCHVQAAITYLIPFNWLMLLLLAWLMLVLKLGKQMKMNFNIEFLSSNCTSPFPTKVCVSCASSAFVWLN